MATETLTCQSCNKEWNRESTRGRKPKVCPSCIRIEKVVVKGRLETIRMTTSDKPEPKYKGKNKWKCPSCKLGVTTYVSVSYEPAHQCQKRGRRWYQLDLVE